MTYNLLDVCTLTPEQNKRTCNYWFTITSGSTPHCAFNRKESLLIWLEERGLKLTEELPEHGVHSWQKIIGEYKTESHMSYDEFYALPAIIESRTLSNGDYVLSRITEENGIRTVHTLNPNCKYRRVFNYNESQAMFG